MAETREAPRNLTPTPDTVPTISVSPRRQAGEHVIVSVAGAEDLLVSIVLTYVEEVGDEAIERWAQLRGYPSNGLSSATFFLPWPGAYVADLVYHDGPGDSRPVVSESFVAIAAS